MTWPRVQITAAPEPGAQVRFDFSQEVRESTWVAASSQFSLGEPGFDTTLAGDLIEGTRAITLPLMVDGPRPKATRTLAQLARVLMRAGGNWLLWQLDDQSPPTWFKLRRNTPGTLDLSRVFWDRRERSTWQWDVTLIADAFGYGALATINGFDISSGLRGRPSFAQQLPPILGDVPAALSMDIAPNYDASGYQQFINCSSVDPTQGFTGAYQYPAVHMAPTPASVYSDKPDPDDVLITTRSTANTGWSGAEVATGTWDGFQPTPGQYALFVLMSGSPGMHGSLRAGTSYLGTYSLSDWAPFVCDGRDQYPWLPVGVVSIPAGIDIAGLDPDAAAQPEISIWHRGINDTVNTGQDVWISRLAALPVSFGTGSEPASSLTVTWQGQAAPTYSTRARLDGRHQRAGIINDLDQWAGAKPPILDGSWPVVRPGMDNWLTMLSRTNGHAVGHTFDGVTGLSMVNSVDITYHPRYLHLAG